ncbi:unnamed protein product [Phaedon cochleariae]|uniref:Uncharacterized protein n=1 Tax=Phaedon cochleariae TaxID=80249 RepID=A0A9N9S9E0_PHACE|nr:unnamed protein product [Phaedon cochleariae]
MYNRCHEIGQIGNKETEPKELKSMEFRRSFVPHRPKRENIPKRVDYRREVEKSQELGDSEESEEWIEWLEIVEDFYEGRVTKNSSENYINVENIEGNGNISVNQLVFMKKIEENTNDTSQTEITTKSKCGDISTQTEFDNRIDVLEHEAIEVVTALNNMEDIEQENAVCSAISTIENQTTEETIAEIPRHTWETDIILENDVTIPARTEAMVYAKLKFNLEGNLIVCEPIELGNGYVHTASCLLENSSKIWVRVLNVSLNNLTKFMAPVTRIIQSYAEEVDCTALTPPLYLIDDQWIGLSPYPTVKKAPEELSPKSHLTLSFAPIQPIGTLAIYTQEEITNAQRILTFGNERKAVENIIARRVAGLETTGQGSSSSNIFNPEEMRELAHNTMQQIWGWFTDLGLFMSGLMGFYAIFRMLKYAIGVILNGFHIYQTMGCRVVILASLWNTLTMWVTRSYPSNLTTAATNAEGTNLERLEEVRTPSIYPCVPTSPHWTEQQSSRETKEM